MPDYVFKVSITLQTPVISQAGGSRPLGVDTAALLDNGFPALPGTLVKGNLREAWTKLAAINPTGFLTVKQIEFWLGKESEGSTESAGKNEPQRSRLRFPACWQAGKATEENKRLNRIAKNPATGAVLGRALQIIEAPHAPGQSIDYHGDITATVTDALEAIKLARWLQKGLEFVPALGAFKGVGYGRVVEVAVESAPVAIGHEAAEEKFSAEGVGLRLALDRPFCFARPHSADSNRFESEDFIPGAAIKGALVWHLEETGRFKETGEFDLLYKHIDKLRFTHALPVSQSATARPVAIPLSWAADVFSWKGGKIGQLWDLALYSMPGLLGGKSPAFQPDWKEKHGEKAANLLSLATPKRALTVRTAIEDGAAKSEELFAVESVVASEHEWLADADLSRVPKADREAVSRQLRTALAEGLPNLGKTKAHGTVTCQPQRHAPAFDSKPQVSDGLAVVVLQSAARLFSQSPGFDSTNGGMALRTAYAESWHTLSDGVFELSHFFARQTLVGGGYLNARFGKSSKPYNPELLTLPGSVFVLRKARPFSDEDAAKVLQAWLDQGLPQPEYCPKSADGKGKQEEDDWAINPWLAVNGYGEVSVNLALHWDLLPTSPLWEAIVEEEENHGPN